MNSWLQIIFSFWKYIYSSHLLYSNGSLSRTPPGFWIYSVLCVKCIFALALNASQTAHSSQLALSNCGICAYRVKLWYIPERFSYVFWQHSLFWLLIRCTLWAADQQVLTEEKNKFSEEVLSIYIRAGFVHSICLYVNVMWWAPPADCGSDAPQQLLFTLQRAPLCFSIYHMVSQEICVLKYGYHVDR